jgi:DNA-binding LytR/AlgR family response regulator
VKVSEIIYVVAENKGVKIITTKGCFITNHKLKDIEDRFMESSLFRCHRSYLINLEHIEHIEPWFNRTYNVQMTETIEKVPISRHYVQAFNEKMKII